MNFETLNESETLAACRRLSIARFGDGELRLATGGAATSQKADQRLAAELRDILEHYDGFIVGIPTFAATPNKATWEKYRRSPFLEMFRQDLYGSAFITRPDNAPWIDTPTYWQAVRELWRDKNVVLVAGTSKSLTPATLEGARSVEVVEVPERDAYSVIDETAEKISDAADLVILCAGAAATCLAARLDARGIHALDLGHIGMFMKHAGMYATPAADLISDHYRALNVQLHADPRGFGGDGKKHAERVLDYATTIGARSICDYGCGEGTLKPALYKLGWRGFVAEYDPAMKGKESLPKPAQLLVSTDVLEHIEPEKLGAVLQHQFRCAELGAFFTIATRPANKILPDGRNAHLIQEKTAWWLDQLRATGWNVDHSFEKTKGDQVREVWVWCRK